MSSKRVVSLLKADVLRQIHCKQVGISRVESMYGVSSRSKCYLSALKKLRELRKAGYETGIITMLKSRHPAEGDCYMLLVSINTNGIVTYAIASYTTKTEILIWGKKSTNFTEISDILYSSYSG